MTKTNPKPKARQRQSPSLLAQARKIRLRCALAKKFPNAAPEVVGQAAREIDGAVQELIRQSRPIRVRKIRKSIAHPGGALEYDRKGKRATATQSLKRLAKIAAADNPNDHNYLWVRAWQEAPSAAIDFLIGAAGGDIAFNSLPTCAFERPAGPKEYTVEELVARTNGTTHQPRDQRMIPLSFPFPKPSAVLPFLPDAIEAAACHAKSKWSRDLLASMVLRMLPPLTGKRLVQPVNLGAGERRKGEAVDFLSLIDAFYKTQFFAKLLRSGKAMANVISLSR